MKLQQFTKSDDQTNIQFVQSPNYIRGEQANMTIHCEQLKTLYLSKSVLLEIKSLL